MRGVLLESLKAGPGHEEAIEVVGQEVVPPLALEAMAYGFREGGLPPGGKEGGLVHVQPETPTPISKNPLSFSPHQARPLGSVKSGKAASPGQTGPRKTSPEGKAQNTFSLRPSS